MPSKNNQQGKPNGFILFAQEIKNQLLQEGCIIKNTPDLIEAASPRWKVLPEEEKKYYKDTAKWEWENRHTTGKYQKSSKNRRDCTGAVISDRVDVVSLNEARRKKEREEVVLSFPKGKAVFEMKFVFMSFICLLEEPEYQPLEVAAVQFSLLHGIEQSWHKFIDPGPIPTGFRFTAQNTSENTHKIPCEGIAKPEDTYTRIYDELFQFLSQGQKFIPPIYVKISETERTKGCIEWLSQKAGRQNQLRRIYELEGLILDLDSHLDESPSVDNTSVATELISSTIFDYESRIRCQWHEENDTTYCALGNVNRYCFCIANYFCESYGIERTSRHLPVKNSDAYYTLIPSQHSQQSSKTSSKAAPRCEPRNTTPSRTQDVVDCFMQKLKLEDENRSREEKKASCEEEKKLHHEEEQKKRWQTLRSESVINNNAIEPFSTSDSSQSEKVEAISNTSRGRGRGRGVVSANLRRPGEPPKSVEPNSRFTESRLIGHT